MIFYFNFSSFFFKYLSGLNLKGDFNTENTTIFEEDVLPETEAEKKGMYELLLILIIASSFFL